MKQYYRLMLGEGSKFADDCYAGNYIGIGFLDEIDFTNLHIHDDWHEFNAVYIPIYLNQHPEKSRIAAGRACATTWMILKGMKKGDILLCPNRDRDYYVAEISSDYYYQTDTELPHRRMVKWLPHCINRSEMSDALRSSVGSGGTYCSIDTHNKELDELLS